LLEGRINLLQKPNPLGRLIYLVIPNTIIGTVIAISLLGQYIVQGFVTTKQLGFQSPAKRIIIAVVVAGLMGFALFAIQRPVSLNSVVVLMCSHRSTYVYCRSTAMLDYGGNCL
jgi:hypothetical protein